MIITMPDPVRRHLCGKLCVDIDVDTCGPAPDLQFPEKEVQLNPCGDGVYPIVFPLPAGTFTDTSKPLRPRLPHLRDRGLARPLRPARPRPHLGALRLGRDRRSPARAPRPPRGSQLVSVRRPHPSRSSAGRGRGGLARTTTPREGVSVGQGSGSGSGPTGRRQQAGFSIFLDQVADQEGRQHWETRLYHAESDAETILPGALPEGWIAWILERIGYGPTAGGRAGAGASRAVVEVRGRRDPRRRDRRGGTRTSRAVSHDHRPGRGPADRSGPGRARDRVGGSARDRPSRRLARGRVDRRPHEEGRGGHWRARRADARRARSTTGPRVGALQNQELRHDHRRSRARMSARRRRIRRGLRAARQDPLGRVVRSPEGLSGGSQPASGPPAREETVQRALAQLVKAGRVEAHEDQWRLAPGSETTPTTASG